LIANLAGIIAPAVTGYMVQASGSFAGAFALAGAIAVLGALSVVVFVRAPRQFGVGIVKCRAQSPLE